MAELTINPDEIRKALSAFAKSYEPSKAKSTEVGHVIDAGDGIAHVEGLPSVMANELIRFADGTLGLALNLDENEIGVVVLGEFTGIEAGQEVFRTGEVLSSPVGDGFLGRVVVRTLKENGALVLAPTHDECDLTVPGDWGDAADRFTTTHTFVAPVDPASAGMPASLMRPMSCPFIAACSSPRASNSPWWSPFL